MGKYENYIENQWLKNIGNTSQISLKWILGFLQDFRLKLIR